MRLTIAGSGDAFGSGGRLHTCFVLETAKAVLLVDCGASALPALRRQGVDPNRVDAVVLSHLHGDHFGGLPFFLLDAQFTRRVQPLTIAGPLGIKRKLIALMEALFENSSKTQQRFALDVVELAPQQLREFGAVKVAPYPVVHGESGGPFLAYRIEAEGRTITYSADTEWTEMLIPAARNADLFICEAYYYDRVVKNHLDLKTLEQHLPDIAPKKLVLTHMSDDMLGRLDRLPHSAASDGLVIEI